LYNVIFFIYNFLKLPIDLQVLHVLIVSLPKKVLIDKVTTWVQVRFRDRYRHWTCCDRNGEDYPGESKG